LTVIAANALGLRLGDQAFAQDVYTDVRNEVIREPERWHDVTIVIELTPWTRLAPATGRDGPTPIRRPRTHAVAGDSAMM